MVTRAQKIGTKRPQTVEQPLTPADCLIILEELPTDLGLELTMLAHQLCLMGTDSGRADAPLFHSFPAEHVRARREAALADAPGDLVADLRSLMTAVTNGATRPDNGEIASSCAFISEWARNAGHLQTAVVFAEAGACVAPDDPRPAFLAGRANRLLQKYWRGEVFYRRAARLAYRVLNYDILIRATLGLGRLMAESGRVDVAEQEYASAASVAETEGLEWLAAQTYHDMLVLHFDSGDLDKALEYAVKALRIYPSHNERMPIAVHDLSFVLIAGQHVEDALPIVRAVFNAPLDAQEQVLVAGTMARAAGLLHLGDELTEAERRLLHFAPNHPYHAAFSFWNLAHGMRAFGLWEKAETYAMRALQLAEETDVDYVRTHVPMLLEEIRARTQAPPPAPALLAGELAEEVRRLSARVSTWHRDPVWKARWGGQAPKKLGTV